MIENILTGFALVFTLKGLIGIGTGILVGYIVGAMPGLTSSIGMALLIPFTFGMDPIAAIVMLVTIYMAADFGGAIPAILVNAPGQPAAAVTAFDGFAMTQRGEAGKALNISIMSSTVGALLSVLFLVATAQTMASAALAFGPAEYFGLAVVGLSLIAVLSTASTMKSLIGLVFGLTIITIGIDPISGASRFVFHWSLIDGIPFLPALIGLFALSEVFLMIEDGNRKPFKARTDAALDLSLRTAWPFRRTILRSSVIGYVVGVIPGAGATIASLISYGVAKKFSPTGESFGRGDPEGVAAAEAANNASVSGALAPLLSLGVPGSASAAVLIGGLTIQGLQPGPMLFANNPEVPYSIFVALFVGLPVMVVIGFAGVPLWVRLTQVPKPIVATVVTSIAMLGAYASANSSFEMMVTAVFGVIGYLLRKADIHPAPIVLALVLGDMMEANLRRALITSNESFLFLLTKPITAGLLLAAAIILLSPLFTRRRMA
ncbi:MAG: tripartite tricarboxylate transporter permease [Paracoccus sp. (in: a-proteobacteria)]|uniref:tripartite tricarboxylate transporter permease n=1 Tax=Paracoccus sp. TaxID=267 RepID=UPI0030010D54